MFRGLHRRLTIICTVGTAAVLIGLSITALIFSLNRLRLQQKQSFQSNMNSVFYYLQAQPAIDQAWLSRTEAANGLCISIRLGERTLRYKENDSQRDNLLLQASALAEGEGFDAARQPDGVTPYVLEFEPKVDGVSYWAAAANVPYQDSWFVVLLLKDRSAELAQMYQMALLYAAITLVATALLTLFAYFFTGRALEPVREAYRGQKEFISAASHELRSPLAVMRMGLGLLRTGEGDAELPQKLEAESDHMARLVEDLLMLARADEDKWSVRMAEASPRTVLLDAYERFETLAGERGVKLDILVGDDVPGTILCDRDRLSQVFAILVDNALRYTPTGGTIRLGLSQSGQDVVFSVEDSGPGIAEEEKQLVFERFYQADQSRSDTGNHGLGLSIAKEIMTLHRGTIEVKDSALGGARFVIKIKGKK